MSATGYIQVHAYESRAQLPLKDVVITVSLPDGTVLASRLTDRSGRISPIPITTPDRDDSRAPGSELSPFTSVTLHASLRGYEQIEALQLQIFADTVTVQDLQMIPLAELPDQWSKSEVFDTPPQNL